MRIALILLTILLPLMSFGQYDYGFLQEFYFGRQANARAEALGMAYSSIDGDIATIGYNPAGTSTLKGAEIMSSIASPLYTLENAEHSYIAAGYNINQYLTIGISRNHFNYGQEITISDAGGQPTGEFTPKTSLYTLNVSSQPIENLMVGINANYLIFDPVDNPAKSLYFDLGVIKKFELWQNLASTHSINLGASISNLNYAETEIEYNGIKSEEDLPVIARFGLNYQLQLDKNWFSDTLNTFNFLIQADYQSLMNSDYHNGIYSGLELTFLEVLSARIGYYQESQFDFDIPSANKDEISALTYGFGLQLPLDKLTKIPLRINFDYTNLPQPSYTKADWNWDNFLSYTLRVNWMLN